MSSEAEFLVLGVVFGLIVGIFHGIGLDAYNAFVGFCERRGWL